MRDTFCILPWIHIYANADGSVLPCCIGDYRMHMGNVRDQSIEEILNGPKYKEMRSKMLKGEKCKECSACYQAESLGDTSFRQHMNNQFEKYIPDAINIDSDGTLSKIDIKYLDIRWSNICNFKCRSCSATYSSTWAQEDNAQGHKKPIHIFAGGKDNNDLYNQFKPYFSGIEKFYFAGGEPLLTDKHYEILDELISIGKTDVTLDYNTNLSNLHYKKKPVTEYWKHFDKVKIGASLDSFGSRAEYIREGTDWPAIMDNIRHIKKCANVEMHISSVISVFNIFTIPEFLDYMYENKFFDQAPLFYNIINPGFYSLNVIPDNLKTVIKDKLNDKKLKFDTQTQNQINKVIAQLTQSKYDKQLHKQFVNTTVYYDRIRNRNFVETFPEIKELLNENIL